MCDKTRSPDNTYVGNRNLWGNVTVLLFFMTSVGQLVANPTAASPWDLMKCSSTTNGSSHHVWCSEPGRRVDATCISTETSTCSKNCNDKGQFVDCSGYCRCQPQCAGRCSASCCKLAYDPQPVGCDPSAGTCTFNHIFYDHSACNSNGTCECGAGYCGFEVDAFGSMACIDGLGAPCMACPLGSYKTTTGTHACHPCPNGTSTRTHGATSATNCERLCPPGYTGGGGFAPCTACEPGSYQDGVGRSSCKLCPAGANGTKQGTIRIGECCLGCAPQRSAAWSGRYSSPAAVAAACTLAAVMLGRSATAELGG